jgi:hypothetical protein
MGTACKEGSYIGIIPRAMVALFDKIESLKSQVEFQLRVSFIEVEEFVSSELNEKKNIYVFVEYHMI